jgi:uncharacterized BrkB/YihY/UPF0761 family membrane protein
MISAGRTLWLQPRPGENVVLRSARQLLTPDSRDRVFLLAGQAFIALVPLVIVTAGVLGALPLTPRMSLVDRFSLEGDVAATVTELFQRPPETTSGVGLASILLLLVTVNSFARSLRRTFEMAWGLPRTPGLRGVVHGLLGVAVLLVMATSVSGLRTATDHGPWWVSLTLGVPIQVAAALAGWLLAIRLLLSQRVAWSALVPGAVFAAGAQLVADWVASIYLPLSLARNAERYGGIGVAISIVYWWLIFAAVVVSVAGVGSELTRGARGRQRDSGPDQPDLN